MSTGKTIAVVGATGTQGRAVTAHLLAAGWTVAALTRTPGTPAAEASSPSQAVAHPASRVPHPAYTLHPLNVSSAASSARRCSVRRAVASSDS